jgi:hypothetical protein
MRPVLKRTAFQKFYAIFLISSIIGPIYFIIKYNDLVFSSFSVEIILMIVCFLFYFYSGIKFWQNPNNNLNVLLVEISLLTQSIKINLYGIKFYSNYGPYAEMGFSDLFNFKMHFELGINILQFSISYENTTSITLLFNIFTIALYVIFIRQVRRKKSEELLITFKSSEFS